MNTILCESTPNGDQFFDVYSKLANDRILFLSDFLDSDQATDIISTLLLKNLEDPEREITLFLNCEGGDIRSVFSILDIMNTLSTPIKTICIGSANDSTCLILASGTPGMRFITKNSTLSFSQLSHDFTRYSDLTDAKSLLNRSVQDNKQMMEILASKTNKSVKDVTKFFERRVFMNSSQILKFGFVDKIIKNEKK